MTSFDDTINTGGQLAEEDGLKPWDSMMQNSKKCAISYPAQTRAPTRGENSTSRASSSSCATSASSTCSSVPSSRSSTSTPLALISSHKDALHHGKHAAYYRQELIANTRLLCSHYEEITTTNTKQPKAKPSRPSSKRMRRASSNLDRLHTFAIKAGTSEASQSRNEGTTTAPESNEKGFRNLYFLEENQPLLQEVAGICSPILRELD